MFCLNTKKLEHVFKLNHFFIHYFSQHSLTYLSTKILFLVFLNAQLLYWYPKEENGFLEMIFSFSQNLMDEKTGLEKIKHSRN